MTDGRLHVTGRSPALFRGRQGTQFRSVTDPAGLRDESLYSHGSAITDLNADGFSDLLVAGYGGLQVWLNGGDGTFLQITEETGVSSSDWNVTVAPADCNRDGLVDLYVLTYADWEPDPDRRCFNDQQLRDVCGPTLFPGAKDKLFFSRGNGKFGRPENEKALVPGNRGLGVVATDFDENGWVDFLVVNDVEENQLYMNHQGTLSDNALLAGVAYSHTGEREGSMGVDAADFDGDGQLDIWYTNYAQQDNSLLRRMSATGYIHTAGVAGLSGVSRRWVGFGTGFADFNCDGWADLFVINGHVAYERRDSPYFQPSQLFVNNRNGSFSNVTKDGGPYFAGKRSGRGAAVSDLNNDGAPDLIVVHQNDPVAVLLNRRSSDAWISIRVVGTTSERSAVGAVIELSSGKRLFRRWVCSGGSYLSHHDSRMLFQLESAAAVDVDVMWPGGKRETFPNLQPNRDHALIQGAGL